MDIVVPEKRFARITDLHSFIFSLKNSGIYVPITNH